MGRRFDNHTQGAFMLVLRSGERWQVSEYCALNNTLRETRRFSSEDAAVRWCHRNGFYER